MKNPIQSFHSFCQEVSDPQADLMNEIYYKGKKLFKYQAWRKFKTSYRMFANPDITIREVENKPVKEEQRTQKTDTK